MSSNSGREEGKGRSIWKKRFCSFSRRVRRICSGGHQAAEESIAESHCMKIAAGQTGDGTSHTGGPDCCYILQIGRKNNRGTITGFFWLLARRVGQPDNYILKAGIKGSVRRKAGLPDRASALLILQESKEGAGMAASRSAQGKANKILTFESVNATIFSAFKMFLGGDRDERTQAQRKGSTL